MHNFPRPSTPTVSAERETVSGTCPTCGTSHLAKYRVMSEGGWWIAVKCQDCLRSISREPGPMLGAFEPLGPPR